jgi:SAM-dependent MidA family methyltransferase
MAVSVPQWVQQPLRQAGGRLCFRDYMELVLHDPQHGAYGSGRLQVGPSGDFATSPSLGPEFAQLLAPQLADWLGALASSSDGPLALVEAGPGEGSLAADLAEALASGWPQLAARLELVLVEPNAGMAARQRQRLAGCPLPCRWSSFRELAAAPRPGVLLAHEVLDALAVQRIVWDGALWRRQEVVLHEADPARPSLRLEPGEPLEPAVLAVLPALGLLPPSPQRPAGWCTELHPGLEPWLKQAGSALAAGPLLVIDYALEAWRYYAPQRADGTLMAYRCQRASADPLQHPGEADLTAHLCIDSLRSAAAAAGWDWLGECRQGQALLALGLAERLHAVQHTRLPQPGQPQSPGPWPAPPLGADPSVDLAQALARREALLRLVDPHTLGDFRWLAFQRGTTLPIPRFLREPGA